MLWRLDCDIFMTAISLAIALAKDLNSQVHCVFDNVSISEPKFHISREEILRESNNWRNHVISAITQTRAEFLQLDNDLKKKEKWIPLLNFKILTRILRSLNILSTLCCFLCTASTSAIIL